LQLVHSVAKFLSTVLYFPAWHLPQDAGGVFELKVAAMYEDAESRESQEKVIMAGEGQ
jgi:hypothetical protein